MNMRERMARAMHESYNKALDRMIVDGLASGIITLDGVAQFRREIEFIKDFDAQVPEKKRDLFDAVDAALDALTAYPGEAVLDAALGRETRDENGIICFEHMTHGEVFQAMIAAIKAGK